MRIEVRQHAVDGAVDELPVLDRLDVAGLDGAEDFGEGAQFFDGQRQARGGRIALRHRGKIQRQQHASQHADEYQPGLLEFAALVAA